LTIIRDLDEAKHQYTTLKIYGSYDIMVIYLSMLNDVDSVIFSFFADFLQDYYLQGHNER